MNKKWIVGIIAGMAAFVFGGLAIDRYMDYRTVEQAKERLACDQMKRNAEKIFGEPAVAEPDERVVWLIGEYVKDGEFDAFTAKVLTKMVPHRKSWDSIPDETKYKSYGEAQDNTKRVDAMWSIGYTICQNSF